MLFFLAWVKIKYILHLIIHMDKLEFGQRKKPELDFSNSGL